MDKNVDIKGTLSAQEYIHLCRLTNWMILYVNKESDDELDNDQVIYPLPDGSKYTSTDLEYLQYENPEYDIDEFIGEMEAMLNEYINTQNVQNINESN